MQAGGQDGAPAVVSGQPQVTEGDCRGQQGRDPRAQLLPPQRGGGDTSPSLPRRSRPGRYSEPASPSTPSLACHEIHTLRKRRSKRSGNWEVRGLVVGPRLWLVGVQGKPGPFRAASPTVIGAPQKVQGPPRAWDHQSSPWSWAGCRLLVPEPAIAIHRKGGWTAAASGLRQAPHPVRLKGA